MWLCWPQNPAPGICRVLQELEGISKRCVEPVLATSQQLKIPAEFSILGVDWKGKARAGKCEATGTGGTLLKSPGLRRKFKARPREVPEFPNQEAARSTSTSRAEILPELKALPQSSPLPPPQNARFKVFSTES